nr:MAG TPA: hypothetical protein [Caudoviricetes sp.]
MQLSHLGGVKLRMCLLLHSQLQIILFDILVAVFCRHIYMGVEMCGSDNTQGFTIIKYGVKFMFEIVKNDIFSRHYIVCPYDKHFVFMHSIMRSVFRVVNICINKIGLHLKRLFHERIRVFFQSLFFFLNISICATDKMELANKFRLRDMHIVCTFGTEDFVYGSLRIVNSAILCSSQRVATHNKHSCIVVAATNSNFYMTELRHIFFFFRTKRTVGDFNLINAFLFKSVSQFVGKSFSSIQQHLATVNFYCLLSVFVNKIFSPDTLYSFCQVMANCFFNRHYSCLVVLS